MSIDVVVHLKVVRMMYGLSQRELAKVCRRDELV